ncbi:MAG: hypothetical protein ACKO2K_12625, partial [Alphaproteobacteria bacterium]
MASGPIDTGGTGNGSDVRGLTVALVDWHWIGHHPMFFRRYADALGDLGATVVPFVPCEGARVLSEEDPAAGT